MKNDEALASALCAWDPFVEAGEPHADEHFFTTCALNQDTKADPVERAGVRIEIWFADACANDAILARLTADRRVQLEIYESGLA